MTEKGPFLSPVGGTSGLCGSPAHGNGNLEMEGKEPDGSVASPA